MTPMRVRAAALTFALPALLALAGAACSSGSVDSTSLPTVGTPAPNTPPGSVLPEDTRPRAGTVPPPSGNASACAGAPFDLSVRTASGEDRVIKEQSSWALWAPQTSGWLFVTSDVDLPADGLREALPSPEGKNLVLVSLTSTVASTQTIPLKAGDRFEAGTATPNGPPAVDVQVRTAAGQPPSTGTLTGSVTVDAVTSEGLCLSVDLHRDAGAQAKGRIAAPFLSVNQSVFTS